MKRILKFTTIIFSLLIGYILGHIFIYWSFVKFFNIGGRTNIILIELLVLLSCSIFFATALAHFRDNIFTRFYYFLAATWLGLGNNLLLFFLVGWIVSLILNRSHIYLPQILIGYVAILLALAYSIYGAWNAFTPRIKRLRVSLENLPKNWIGKKMVLISDAHFGNIFTERYAHDLADEINKLHPDLILISGDLFDGTDERLDTFIAPLKKLKASKGIYYVTGNHETYLEANISSIISKTKIHQLFDEVVEVDGLQIVGVDYPKRGQHKDIFSVLKKLSKFDKKKPSILLWHTPTQMDAAKKAGISLQLSGHTHKGQLFPYGIVSRLVYRGYDYGFKQEGNFAIYTSSGLGGWGPPMRTEKTSEIVEFILLN